MKLINTDDIKYQMLYKENFLKGTGVEAPAVWKSDIDAMPAVDAVPVVRCKDCKHSRTEELTVKSKVGFLETRIIRFCNKNEMPIAVRADMHFCSWGER